MQDSSDSKGSSRQQQQQALDRAGVPLKLDHFDLWHMMIPNEGTSDAGEATFSKRGSWGDCIGYESEIHKDCGTNVILHELYHSLGLGHSSAGRNVYGNEIDIMGDGVMRIGLPYRYKLGWAPRNQLHLVRDLTIEHTFEFDSFESKTSSMIGVMIPLNCTTVFLSRDNAGDFMVEYFTDHLYEYTASSRRWPAIETHRVSQAHPIKVDDRYYDPMADVTVERTTKGAHLYPGRHDVTHKETSLVADVNKMKDKRLGRNLKTPFRSGCGVVPEPTDSCSGDAPGEAIPGVQSSKKVALRRQPGRLGTMRYECRAGEWVLESGLPVQYCRDVLGNTRDAFDNPVRCP